MLNKELLSEARKHVFYLVLSILLGAAIGGAIIWQAWLVSKIISQVFLENHSLQQVKSQIGLLVAVIFVRAILLFLRDMASGELSSSVMYSLRNELFSRVFRFGPVGIGKEQTGELSSVIFQGIERLDVYFREYMPQLFLAGIIPVLILVFVFPLDWLTGLIFLFTAPLIPMFMILIGKQAEYETQRQWKNLGLLNGYFFDVVRGLETLKNFGQSKSIISDIRRKSERHAELTLKVLRIAFLSALVLEMLATISAAVVAVQIGLRLMYGRMAFVDGLFLLVLAPEFYFPLRQLGASFHSGKDGVAAAERIFSLLDQSDVQVVSQDSGDDVVKFEEKLEFQNVSYQYTDREKPSVIDLNFMIKAGQKTALVGPSGAGKSTTAALVLGFVHPQEGQIKIDGARLLPETSAAWREKIGYIPQFPYLFQGTVIDNLRIVKENTTFEEIEEAIRLANADEFINNLPEKYETILGEDGTRLSRGQAQRIALARAFLRKAPLLVVDEPTASLDPKNDRLIGESLKELMRLSTVLVIAHRLPTVMDADQILVFDAGRIVEFGKHPELLEKQGLYSKLVAGSEGAA